MNIVIWGDYACPYCYLGETQLEKILAENGKSESVKITFKSYEIDPNAPVIPTETMTQHFMGGHKISEEEAKQRMERVVKMAARVGLDYKLATAQVCNTYDAHRLMAFGQDSEPYDKVLKLNFALFRANFIENKRLSDKEVLLDIAEECGLDRNAAKVVLDSNMYGDQVRAEEKEIDERKDFEFVPYMLFDDKEVLQGVISAGAMKKALGVEN